MINEDVVKTLEEQKISIEAYLYLYCVANSLDWHRRLKVDKESTIKTLTRRGFLENLEVTERGLSLLDNKPFEGARKVTVTNSYAEKFDEFWSKYPVSDKIGGWPRTRTLRANSIRCRKLFYDLIKEGIDAEFLIKALEKDVEIRLSGSRMENRFTYMPSITTWLSSRAFEGFVEQVEEEGTKKYGQDIE
jgi:hypothetical protein